MVLIADCKVKDELVSVLFTGGSLTFGMPEQQSGLYGNNVTFRENILERGALKSFVDFHFLLPDSQVLAFYVYANTSRERTNTSFRLQIWRPVELTIARWQLVWQQHVQLTNTTHGLYTVSTSQQRDLHAIICEFGGK